VSTDNTIAPAIAQAGESAPPQLDAEGRLMLRMVQLWLEGFNAPPDSFQPQAFEARMDRLRELHMALYRTLTPEIRLRDVVVAIMAHLIGKPEQMGPAHEAWLAVTQEMVGDLERQLGGSISAYLAATEQRAKAP